jgi:uncharacterized protein YndB with AHSA1/START domain
MLVEESIEIRRPPEVVWAVVSDPRNDPRWCPKVKSVQAAGAQRWDVQHRPVPLRPSTLIRVEHLVREEPYLLTMREEDDASIFDVEYRLEASSDGTRFTQISAFQWKTLPRVLHRTFERGVRRDVKRQLRELKRLLESM